jgi:hypothetical protein
MMDNEFNGCSAEGGFDWKQMAGKLKHWSKRGAEQFMNTPLAEWHAIG